ncbi:2-isopropylmalate synthase [Trichinella pseudospiralis]
MSNWSVHKEIHLSMPLDKISERDGRLDFTLSASSLIAFQTSISVVSQTGLSLVRRILPSQSAHSYSACATCYISSIIRLIDLSDAVRGMKPCVLF